MIMVIAGVFFVSIWTAVVWLVFPTRMVWKVALSSVDKTASEAISKSFKFLLNEFSPGDLPANVMLDAKESEMESNALAWAKEEYLKAVYVLSRNMNSYISPTISEMILLSNQLLDDPYLWRLKELNQRIIDDLTTCYIAISYTSIWIERFVRFG